MAGVSVDMAINFGVLDFDSADTWMNDPFATYIEGY